MQRYSVKRTVTVDKTPLSCVVCRKELAGERALKSHCTQMHSGDKDTSKRGKPTGIPAWNRGLTKDTDSRVAQYANSNRGKPGKFTGRSHTDDTKLKISKKLSINNKGGRAKWYTVAGQRVQGTWERDIAYKLEELCIEWYKLKTNKHTLQYVMDNKIRSYTPDFFLPAYDIYLEVKGFWWGRDKEKMELVQQAHPQVRICIIEKEQFDSIMRGELVWSFQRQTENL